MRKKWALTAACVLALSACSSESSPEAPETDTVETASTHKMGEMVEGKGASMKINDAYTADSYELVTDTYPTEQREKIEARKDGQIVVVETTVLNQGKDEMDLTCGFGLQVELVSDKDSNYTPVDDLSDIPGNPECNAKLGTDFDDDMTWIFEIPKSHTPAKIGFANPTDNYDELTYIELDKLGSKPKGGSDRDEDDDAPQPTQSSEAPEEDQSTEPDAPVAESDSPSSAPASAPAYGVPCSIDQVLQPGVGPSGEPLVCVSSSPNSASWVYGPPPSGETVSDGQECVDGESGAQDSQGRMMMCVGGTWVYGP